MAQIKNFGLVGVGSQVQFGKAGPQLVNNTGVFAFRDATNANDADVTAGNLTLSGNLQVNGTTTTVNTTSITTADQTIILSNGSTTDSMANGAGIVVQGATQHSILFDNTNSAFTTTENFNLVTGKQYEIGGVAVLTGTTLGSSITSSSLTTLGDLTSLTVTGTSNLEGAVTAGSTLAVTGDTTLSGALGVTGATTLAGLTAGTSALGATTVTGGLTTDTFTATGASTLAATSVTGGLSTDTLSTTGNVTVGGTLGVTGATTLAALTATSAQVTGLAGSGTRTLAVDASGNLVASGASGSFSGTDATVGDVYISGDTITTIANSPLVLTSEGGAVSVGTSGTSATLTVYGATTLAGLTAGTSSLGETTVAGGLTTDTLDATGNSTVGGTLGVTGAATLSGGATVTGGLTTDTLTATGASTLAAVTATSITDSGLTAGQVVFAGTAGLLSDSSALTFNSTTGVLTATGFATAGVTVNATTVTGLADPVNPTDAVNLESMTAAISSAVGAAATDTAHAAYIAYSYTSTSPVTIASNVTGFVHRIKVYVNTAFTDDTATVIVQAATAGALTATGDVDPTGVACYVVELAQPVTADTLQIAITPATSTAGAGYVVVEWV